MDFATIMSIAYENGGVTLEMDGNVAIVTKGYMVADDANNRNYASLLDLTEADLEGHLAKARAQEGAYVGLYRRADGTWDMDISHSIMDLGEALAKASGWNQESIYDCANGTVIFCEAK